MERLALATRKILHINLTSHPTAEWTLQQFREAIPCEHDYRFVIVDRDGKFSEDLRRSVRSMGVRVLRTPRIAPQANAYCERLLGTTRRECLDYLIPLSEIHLRRVLAEWGQQDEAMSHYGENWRIRQRLVAMDPTNRKWESERAVILRTLGRAHLESEQYGLARERLTVSKSILEGLTVVDDTNRDWRRQLVGSLVPMGELLHAEGRFAAAEAEAIAAAELAC